MDWPGVFRYALCLTLVVRSGAGTIASVVQVNTPAYHSNILWVPQAIKGGLELKPTSVDSCLARQRKAELAQQRQC